MISTARLTILLAMTVAMGPFAIDAYLPSFPRIAETLGVEVHDVSLTISVYMLAFAFGQLFGGALSDSFGRRWVMLSGVAVFSLSSVLIALSGSLTELLIWRAAQAFGAGFTAVSVPAIVRDRATGREAATLFSLIGLIMIIAPAIAPTVGSAILAVSDWPMIFIFLAAYSAMMIVLLWFGLFARLETIKRAPRDYRLLPAYLAVLSNPSALRFIMIITLGFSSMLIFLTHASYIYQKWFGLSEFGFSAVFAANIATMAGCNFLNRFLLKRMDPDHILKFSVPVQALAIGGLVAAAAFDIGLWMFVPCMMVSVGSLGMIGPNAQACAMHHFEHQAGTAASIMGFTQFMLAGAISAASALVPESLINITLFMGACGFLCAALALAPAKPLHAHQL
ncbi:multidrug effflux MFS transporter [Tepidicaulis sp.]|uniref:multidrug effflux MFS transporter n=1 Tax=Tepidicaulis sp. TaxID=1920809 RepID=UPI003B5AFD3F